MCIIEAIIADESEVLLKTRLSMPDHEPNVTCEKNHERFWDPFRLQKDDQGRNRNGCCRSIDDRTFSENKCCTRNRTGGRRRHSVNECPQPWVVRESAEIWGWNDNEKVAR
jgi:hypothetical protein